MDAIWQRIAEIYQRRGYPVAAEISLDLMRAWRGREHLLLQHLEIWEARCEGGL